MIKVENPAAWGFSAAIRGMRNPLASWDKSDSYRDENGEFVVGEADLALMCKLCQAGPEHRKFMRQITVSMDITAPLYWWKEYDTYKVGTVADSCSTMHTIHKREFTLDDFSTEHLSESGIDCMNGIIEVLNAARNAYVNYDALNEEYKNIPDLWEKGITCKKDLWWQMIQLLPSSYNQKRTVTFNYENAWAMIHQRTGHKLDEWRKFVEELKGLPFMRELIGGDRL